MPRVRTIVLSAANGTKATINSDGSQNFKIVPPETEEVCINASSIGTFELLPANATKANRVILLFAISNGNNAIVIKRGGTTFLGPIDLIPQVGFHLGIDANIPVITTDINQAITFSTETTAEVSSSLASGRKKSTSIAITTSGSSALSFGKSKSVYVVLGPETDTAQSISRSRVVYVGNPSESDSSQSVGKSKRLAHGQSSEADSATSTGKSKRRSAGYWSEADSAQGVGRSKRIAVGYASDFGAVIDFSVAKQFGLGMAFEDDEARQITVYSPTTGTVRRLLLLKVG